MKDRPPGALATALSLLGVLLILIGFFSPWIPHRAAGLAITGFELGEWIKFAPELREGSSPLRRGDFYWPPALAALALAAVVGRSGRRGWANWLLILLAALLALLPFPLLEELSSAGGIRANLGRLALVGLGLAAAAGAALQPRWPSSLRGALLALGGVLGVVLVSGALAAAEPIVERLFRQLIDPGPGYNLTRGGMLLIALAGLVELVGGQPGKRPPE